jgi:hypothetical protein
MPSDQEKAEANQLMLGPRLHAAHSTALCVLIEMLITKGVLGQGEVIARYEALSQQFMTVEGGTEMVALADQITDFAAGRAGRKPS